MHFFEKFLQKNLEKVKCLTYLCTDFEKNLTRMAIIKFQPDSQIRAISGRIGNTIFYIRNGKQCARRVNRSTPPEEYRSIIEALSVHHRV